MAKPLSEQQILVAKRRKARHYGVQALYQWIMAGAALNQIEAEFRVDYDFEKVDGEVSDEFIRKYGTFFKIL